MKLIGEVDGKRVVELGCGGGQCSIAFAKRGAKVIGIDLSERQLDFARDLAARKRVKINFTKGDIENLSAIPDATQDIVFSAYAFQFVKNLKMAFDEVYRVLNSGGMFVFSLDHPFHWCLPEEMSRLEIVHGYFDERRRRGDLGYEYPRSFSELSNGLFDAGFIVAKIIEPAPVERRGKWDRWPEYSLARLRMVPATLVIKALKPHGLSEILKSRKLNRASVME